MKYPHLFEPIKVAGTVFRNRIFASPEGYYNVGMAEFEKQILSRFLESF